MCLWDGWNQGGTIVLLEMVGGCDGLNLLVPFRNDWYYRRRPHTSVPPDRVLPLNDTVGFPESLSGIYDLFSRGLVAVLQGVGFEQPAGTHYGARSRWSRILLNRKLDDPDAVTCPGVEEFQQRAAKIGRIAGTRPNQFFRLGLRGFDTHVRQGRGDGWHGGLLKAVSDAVTRLTLQLIREGRIADVLILVATEFGRSVEENAWAGTDHGDESPWLLIGGGVVGGVHGRPSQLGPLTMVSERDSNPVDPESFMAEVVRVGV